MVFAGPALVAGRALLRGARGVARGLVRRTGRGGGAAAASALALAAPRRALAAAAAAGAAGGLGGGSGGVWAAVKLSALVSGGLNLAGFAVTAATGTHKITDLTGSAAFVASAWATYLLAGPPATPVALLSTVAVTLWGVRLGGFLFYRILTSGEDTRLKMFFKGRDDEPWFTGPSRFPLKLAGFWTLQSLWSIFCLLPITALHASSPAGPVSPLQLACLGSALAAWAYESVADLQKHRYRAQRKEEGTSRWCDVGLWKLSRHPNYAGEMLVWWSFWGLTTVTNPANAWTVVSPLFITWLLTSVSGVPFIAAANEKKYGKDPEYRKYLAETPLFVPALFAKGDKSA